MKRGFQARHERSNNRNRDWRKDKWYGLAAKVDEWMCRSADGRIQVGEKIRACTQEWICGDSERQEKNNS